MAACQGSTARVHLLGATTAAACCETLRAAWAAQASAGQATSQEPAEKLQSRCKPALLQARSSSIEASGWSRSQLLGQGKGAPGLRVLQAQMSAACGSTSCLCNCVLVYKAAIH